MPETTEAGQTAPPAADLRIDAGLFGIDTTHFDNRAHALPYCKACGGRVARPFRTADLAEILAAIRLHECPKWAAGKQS